MRTIPPAYRGTVLSPSEWASVKGDSPYQHVTVPLVLSLSVYSEDKHHTALIFHFHAVTSFHSKTFHTLAPTIRK